MNKKVNSQTPQGETDSFSSPLTRPPKTKFQLHLTVEAPQINAIDLIASHSHLLKRRIKQTMKNGAVWLTRQNTTARLRRAKKALLPGDKIHLYFDLHIQDYQPVAPTLIEDHGNYSIWHKPSGMYSQGTKWGDHCTISRWVETHLQPQRPAFSIHRLDRATSGIMVIAHAKKTAAALARQFETRTVQKKYFAITASPPAINTFTIDKDIDGKKAISRFQLIKADSSYSLFDVNIETGRKHQIRKHLASQNMPIVGDRLYGKAQFANMEGQPDLQLTAYSISFLCPIEKNIKTWTIPDEYYPNLEALP